MWKQMELYYRSIHLQVFYAHIGEIILPARALKIGEVPMFVWKMLLAIHAYVTTKRTYESSCAVGALYFLAGILVKALLVLSFAKIPLASVYDSMLTK